MRSLLISASVLMIGTLAAMPFRKSTNLLKATTSANTEDIAVYQSPMQELDVEVDDDSALLPLSGSAQTNDAASNALHPPLPKSRRPFGRGFATPDPILPQPSISRPELSSYAVRPEWSMNLPIAQPSAHATEAPGGTLAQDGESYSRVVADSESQTPEQASDSLASEQGLTMQPTAARSNVITSTENTPRPEAAPRERHFIYEPAN